MKFTPEFIQQQRELADKASPRPWSACACGKCGLISTGDYPVAKVTIGDWGDDYPTLKMTGGKLDRKVEAVMEQITYGHIPDEISTANATLIVTAVNNYPDALAEIERLRAAARWIPVSERLPEIDTLVLWYDCENCEMLTGMIDRLRDGKPIVEVYHSREGIHLVSTFTHWMPLPKPPEVE